MLFKKVLLSKRLDPFALHIPDQQLMLLIQRMLARLDDVNGELFTVDTGINKGNALSPLLDTMYLKLMGDDIGNYCQRYRLKYYRFMDDWLILCKTRYQLRVVVKLMNGCLAQVKQKTICSCIVT